MESMEASRVSAVLDDTLESLRLLSYASDEVVESADEVADVLGEDVCEVLAAHRDAVSAWLQAPAGPGAAAAGLPPQVLQQQAMRSTLRLLRALRQSPSAEGALASLQPDRSPAALQALEYLGKLVAVTRKRLGTTVEEDAARREQQAVLRERHGRAAAERLQLEHRLKLHRLERSRQLGTLQAVHDAAAGELAALHAEAGAARAAAESSAAAEAAADAAAFQEQLSQLNRELGAAQAELETQRQEGRGAALAARKARRRAEGDCEAAIGEYDAEVGARGREVDAAEAAHAELARQIEECAAEVDALRRERAAHDEAARAAAEEARRVEFRRIRLDAAAAAIQNAWKGLRRRRAAEAKGASKGRGKGGAGKQAGAKAARASAKKK